MSRAAAVVMLSIGCAPVVSPALTAATPNPPPFVDSIFAQCAIYETDSGRAGRSLLQREVQPSAETIGACPRYLVTSTRSNTSETPPQSTDRYIYYLNSYIAPSTCEYVNPAVAASNSTMCKLTRPAPWPDAP
ncbi:MAG TPA: hypothetical protein VGL86_17850 [Polyangia bacterium]|jgi:hypothetical protein